MPALAPFLIRDGGKRCKTVVGAELPSGLTIPLLSPYVDSINVPRNYRHMDIVGPLPKTYFAREPDFGRARADSAAFEVLMPSATVLLWIPHREPILSPSTSACFIVGGNVSKNREGAMA
ncbi:MAG: hypothetical protein ACO1SX_14025 [Actinomycetota bacterium]